MENFYAHVKLRVPIKSGHREQEEKQEKFLFSGKERTV